MMNKDDRFVKSLDRPRMSCERDGTVPSRIYSIGPRAALEAAAPCGGAATSITWGLRVAPLRRLC
jgi:hypothetical protein